MKLYGYTRNLSFPCICLGKKCYFFKLKWYRKHPCFKWYFGKSDADNVAYNFIKNCGHRFVGIVIKEEKDIDLFND